jgi:RimJ/RimL family protein N-acetyltransferase
MRDLSDYLGLINNVGSSGEYWSHVMRSEANLRRQFEENGLWSVDKFTLVICTSDGSLIGEIGAERSAVLSSDRTIYYRIFQPENRRRGYMTSALSAGVKWMFETFPERRLSAITPVANVPSIKVAERCGFEREGTLRSAVFVNGEYSDVHLYGRVR